MAEQGESIHFIASYVHDLVDCYLQLGNSSQQGWNPRGWLLSKIQLPVSLPESMLSLLGMDQNNEIELDRILDRSKVVKFSLDRVNKSHVKSVVMDIMNQNNRADIIQKVIYFLNAIVISISVSSAVLKHANEHFQSQSLCENDEVKQLKKKKRRLGAMKKLIQFQLAKVHRMQSICSGIFYLLKGIFTEFNRIREAELSTGRQTYYVPNNKSHTVWQTLFKINHYFLYH